MTDATTPSLTSLIAQQIHSDGPISVADYMALALYHPKHGYYVQGHPLGAEGDFITAPEISQIFGELIGLWLVQSWYEMGTPENVHLVELGPGRGTLMQDILRAARLRPAFLKAANVHLVESNVHLREAQKETLANLAEPTWHNHFAEVPEGPLLLIANEFFDCLPIRQYVRTDRGWYERRVGLDQSDQLTFVLNPLPLLDTDVLGPVADDASEGAIIETCQPGQTLITEITDQVTTQNGRALIIDYGYAKAGTGETLQALKNHIYANVLHDPGKVDLTAHVNFAALAHAAKTEGAEVQGPQGQGAFLNQLGITARADALCQAASADTSQDIRQAVARLCDEDQMGTLFQVLAISAPHLPPAAGF